MPYLSVSHNTDRRAVLLHLVKVRLNDLPAILVHPLLGVLSECLLLGLAPGQMNY